MAQQNQNRGMQRQPQGQNRQMQNRPEDQNQPETYYSYSYGYGYYDPWTGQYYEEYYGPFTGVGPQDYQRSDDRIEEDVCDRLTQHGQLDASDVNVDVNDGEVKLTGSVPDRRMKRLAEDIAYNVPGVFDVQNQLRINKQQGQLGQGQQGRQQPRQMGQGQQSQASQGQNFKSQLKTGMEVLGSDGKSVGTVKEIHDFDILIDRPLAKDVHVPFSSIQSVKNFQVHLNLPADQVDKMHWATSEKQPAPTR